MDMISFDALATAHVRLSTSLRLEEFVNRLTAAHPTKEAVKGTIAAYRKAIEQSSPKDHVEEVAKDKSEWKRLAQKMRGVRRG